MVQELSVSLPNQQATRSFGMALGQTLTTGSVLLLQGDLGSGKTTLVQGMGQGLGISDPIVSPTFILLNEYSEGRIPLYHFDLYRLTTAEVSALHLELYWEGREYAPGIVAIEWAERLPYLPAGYLKIHLRTVDSIATDLTATDSIATNLTATEIAGRQATLTAVGIAETLWDSLKIAIKG